MLIHDPLISLMRLASPLRVRQSFLKTTRVAAAINTPHQQIKTITITTRRTMEIYNYNSHCHCYYCYCYHHSLPPLYTCDCSQNHHNKGTTSTTATRPEYTQLRGQLLQQFLKQKNRNQKQRQLWRWPGLLLVLPQHNDSNNSTTKTNNKESQNPMEYQDTDRKNCG